MTEERLPQNDLWRAVIIRAIFDALGFTNVTQSTRKGQEEHDAVIADARLWFLDATPDNDFEYVCSLADVNHEKCREVVLKLMHARKTGDHTGLPDFWRDSFKRGYAPSLTWLKKHIDELIAKAV